MSHTKRRRKDKFMAVSKNLHIDIMDSDLDLWGIFRADSSIFACDMAKKDAIKTCRRYNAHNDLLAACKTIKAFLGNVSFGMTAGGFNDAKRYGDMLDDIRKILIAAIEQAEKMKGD